MNEADRTALRAEIRRLIFPTAEGYTRPDSADREVIAALSLALIADAAYGLEHSVSMWTDNN